jgi:uncharacterized repeat protein (TIGR03803 family)
MDRSPLRRIAFFALVIPALLVLAPLVAAAQGYLAVHSFDSPLGANPNAPLLQNPGDGFLYGTTSAGGANSAGTVFKMDANGNNFAVLHDFNTTDGSQPESGLILATNGFLYGTTAAGGTFAKGTIFKIDTAGGNFSTIRHLDGDVDGEEPRGRLVQADDTNLYGVTHSGGANNFGTFYRIDLNGTAYAVLHAFGASTEGTRPGAGLIQGSDGRLYGTTELAAAGAGDGTVFGVALNGSNLTTLHTFAGAPNDGQTPSAELLEASDGVLYGTAEFAGSQSGGIAFALHRDGTAFQVLHNFGGADGTRPRAPLVENQALLWGTAYGVGANNGGTLFHITRAGGLFAVVHDFAAASGEHAHAAVLVGSDGALYGTTEVGGAHALGVVYRFTNPTLTSITPSAGPGAGATPVTIAGTLFQGGASVTIGGAVPTGISIAPTQITASTPALAAGTLNDVIVTNPDKTIGSIRNGFLADFLDVPQGDIFHDFVEKVFRSGITAGCGGGNYCRNNSVTRAQMAVFLLKSEHGPNYAPPTCAGIFTDVECLPTPAFAVDWIEQLFNEGITGGCGTGIYCPNNPVTREQMAVFLLKTKFGSGYAPPACTAIFTDVPCPSQYANWIVELYNEGITGGCGVGLYCPTNPNTRGQMAVFLVKTFNLP